MNMASSVAPGSGFESQPGAPPCISAIRRMRWLVRRELWESRWLYLAPLGVAVLALLGFVIHVAQNPDMAGAMALHANSHHSLDEPYAFTAAAILATVLIVALLYSLDALYGERRDRSILFWKSLPVSDLETVLSKASITFVVLPLIGFAVTTGTQFVMLLVSSLFLAARGTAIGPLWAEASLVRMPLMMLYHMFTVHVLWSAPVYAWWFLVSAWARRAPILWAVIPPAAVGAVEKIAFNTTHFGKWIGDRFMGGPEAITPRGALPTDAMTQLTPLRLLTSPGLWIGLAIAVAFLAAATRLRRHQGPI